MSAADRFRGKFLIAPSGCWIWMGSTTAEGYGRFSIDRKGMYAHRASHELFVGPVPDGFQVDHLCRRTRCVNPMHLQAVPPRVNLLRSMGITAMAAAKTRCSEGHLFDSENTYIDPRGRRQCRICRRARRSEYGRRRVLTPEQLERRREQSRLRRQRQKEAS
jgi:hypothetical protein